VVNISHESRQQTALRLTRVIQLARLKVYAEEFVFEEFPLDQFANRAHADSLALVRDDQVWSQLVVADATQHGDALDRFAVWRFHFPDGADNSGFVGWLASHLKERFGTGVFVTCGQNSADGGIFDYWGCPVSISDDVIAEVRRLVSGEQ
jgi:hypothetical protein